MPAFEEEESFLELLDLLALEEEDSFLELDLLALEEEDSFLELDLLALEEEDSFLELLTLEDAASCLELLAAGTSGTICSSTGVLTSLDSSTGIAPAVEAEVFRSPLLVAKYLKPFCSQYFLIFLISLDLLVYSRRKKDEC